MSNSSVIHRAPTSKVSACAIKWQTDDLKAALIILGDLRQFPPESLAHQWARRIVEKDARRAA